MLEIGNLKLDDGKRYRIYPSTPGKRIFHKELTEERKDGDREISTTN